MSDYLSNIVQGKWSEQTHDANNPQCFHFCGPPTLLSLKYHIGDEDSDGEWFRKAVVTVSAFGYRCRFYAYGDTDSEALQALIDEWRDEIEQFAGTIHPAVLEAKGAE